MGRLLCVLDRENGIDQLKRVTGDVLIESRKGRK